VPVVSGVGHETDFTIADFVADLRAPTPTAAAELVAEPQANWLGALDLLEDRLRAAVQGRIDRAAQRLDLAASRLGRPSSRLHRQGLELNTLAQRLKHAAHRHVLTQGLAVRQLAKALPLAVHRDLQGLEQQIERKVLKLQGLDPKLVLQRGYAWLTDDQGHAVTRAAQSHAGQALTATLADGQLALKVVKSSELQG
jgi:exodeoxyribonuclease VII large subunit